MKKIFIAAIVIAIVIGGYFFLRSAGSSVAGGGGSQTLLPENVKAGEPATIGLIVNAWGKGGPIQGRFTDIHLGYRLAGGTEYKILEPRKTELPENYQKASTDISQWEAYEFEIPPYPIGTTGEIEYYVEYTFDGNPARHNSTSRLKIF